MWSLIWKETTNPKNFEKLEFQETESRDCRRVLLQDDGEKHQIRATRQKCY